MAKRSEKPQKTQAAAPGDPAAASVAATWATVALGALAAIYLLVFLATNSRLEAVMSRLLVPDLVVAEWFGPPGTPRGFFDRLPVFAVAGWILLAAYGAGRAVLDDLRWARDVSLLEHAVLSLAVGLNGLSLLTLGIGLAGGLQAWWLFAAILAVLSLAALWRLAVDVRRRRDHWSQLWRERDHWSRLWNPQSAIVAVILIFALLMLLAAPLPPWDFDVREYHLQVPKEWHQQGRITFLPHNVYGNMPLGAEMHALAAMTVTPGALGWYYGALAGKVVMAAMTLVTAAGLFAAGRRIANSAAGLIAAAVYVSHPWVCHVSTSGLNDGVLAGYVFLAAFATWLARDGRVSPLLPGFLAGAAAATKYPGVAFAAIPLTIWMALPAAAFQARAWQRIRWSAAALFVAGALAGGGLWYAKNAALTGNPTYPLLAGMLDGQTRTPERIEQWERAHQVPRDGQGRRYSLSQAAAAGRQIAVADGLASPLMIPFATVGVLALLIACRQSAIRNPQSALAHVLPLAPFALLLLAILVVWWFATHRIDRFLLPAWPLAALLAGIGLVAVELKPWRWICAGLLAIGFLYCLLLNTSLPDHRLFVSLEQLRRDGPWPADYLLQRTNADHHWLNEHVPPGEAVLLVGDAEPFELTMPAYYNTCFDSSVLCDLMLSRTAAERKEALASRKIAFVYVHWPEIDRYQETYGFDPRFDPGLIDELVAQGVLGPALTRGEADGLPAAVYSGRQPEIYPVLAGAGDEISRRKKINAATPASAPATSAIQSQTSGERCSTRPCVSSSTAPYNAIAATMPTATPTPNRQQLLAAAHSSNASSAYAPACASLSKPATGAGGDMLTCVKQNSNAQYAVASKTTTAARWRYGMESSPLAPRGTEK